jgi:hypothetical protein
MSMGRKLIQKLVRRMKFVKERAGGYDRYEKADKLDEVMKDSPGVYRAMVHPQRKADGGAKAGMGADVVMKKPRLEYKAKASTLERFDYDPGAGFDYGIRATMPAGLIADSRVQAGDVVEVLSGAMKGMYLSVVAVTDSTHLRLEDVAAYAGPESNKYLRMQLSSEKKSYK